MEQVQQAEIPPIFQVLAVDNVAEYLEEARLAAIGDEAVRMYQLDRSSMGPWLERMKKGIELATLQKQTKTTPWKNASNVKYPLITTAALQFNARAYPAIVPSGNMVHCATFGADAQGLKAARGERVAAHMSWQLGSQIEEWESDTDKLLVMLPTVGTMVRKVWYDPVAGRTRCRLIDPGKFIVNDKVKSLDDAPRATEELSFYPFEIEQRKRSGAFLNADYIENGSEDSQAPEDFIEQHCRIDIDEDGYEEPYIVTVHVKSRKVARIVADFEESGIKMGQGGVVAVERDSYFVDYHFLPSIDGGFFGTGFGLLLADLSESVNTAINMIVDAAHASSRGGGFIGSEFRIKGGSHTWRPGEWKTVNATGKDIREAMIPMTLPGPDATLFSLLGLLVDAAKEVASVKDILTGDTGTKNMTATTTLALIEQGMMVFTASYKRIFRSLKREFKLIGRINAMTVTTQEYNAFHDEVGPDGQPMLFDPKQEYGFGDMDIQPVADPSSVTKMQEVAKAQILMEMAQAGLVDQGEASRRILEAGGISNVDELAPQPDPMQQQMTMMAMQREEADLTLKLVEVDAALANIEKTRSETMKNLSDIDVQEYEARMNGLKTRLEAVKDGIEAHLAAGLGRVAGSAGGAGGPQMPSAGPVAPQGGPSGVVLPGPTGAGILPAGALVG